MAGSPATLVWIYVELFDLSFTDVFSKENSLALAAVFGFAFAAVISIAKIYGKTMETVLQLDVFKTRQQAALMNITRHHAYNANRVLVRLILDEKPDERFLRKLKTEEARLLDIEKDAERFAYLPKEVLYRIEHLLLLIRSVNIDAESDIGKEGKMDTFNLEIYYKRMFRRFMTIAVLADAIEHYLQQSKACGFWRIMWNIIRDRQTFIVAPDGVLDSRISEVEKLTVKICMRVFVDYVNKRHLDQLEGRMLDHIAKTLDYPVRKPK